MKKSIIIMLCLFANIVFSQDENDTFLIEKGTWVVEGDFGLNFGNSNNVSGTTISDNSGFSFNIAPKVGYFISDNLQLGLGLAYGYTKFDNSDGNSPNINETTSKRNSYGIFPYLKKFFPVGKKLSFHLVAETRFEVFNTNFVGNDNFSESSSDVFSINLRPGINYRFTDHILMQANFGRLGYNYAKQELDDTTSRESNDFGFNLSSSSLTFGIVVLL